MIRTDKKLKAVTESKPLHCFKAHEKRKKKQQKSKWTVKKCDAIRSFFRYHQQLHNAWSSVSMNGDMTKPIFKSKWLRK